MSRHLLFTVDKQGTPRQVFLEDDAAASGAWAREERRVRTGKVLGAALERVEEDGTLASVEATWVGDGTAFSDRTEKYRQSWNRSVWFREACRRLVRGEEVLCETCRGPLVLRLLGSGYHPGIYCGDGCTMIMMEFGHVGESGRL
jgi:hypothetical protein